MSLFTIPEGGFVLGPAVLGTGDQTALWIYISTPLGGGSRTCCRVQALCFFFLCSGTHFHPLNFLCFPQTIGSSPGRSLHHIPLFTKPNPLFTKQNQASVFFSWKLFPDHTSDRCLVVFVWSVTSTIDPGGCGGQAIKRAAPERLSTCRGGLATCGGDPSEHRRCLSTAQPRGAGGGVTCRGHGAVPGPASFMRLHGDVELLVPTRGQSDVSTRMVVNRTGSDPNVTIESTLRGWQRYLQVASCGLNPTLFRCYNRNQSS